MEKKIINKNEKEYVEYKLQVGDVIRPLYNKIHHRVYPTFTKHSLLVLHENEEKYVTLTDSQYYQLMIMIKDGKNLTHHNIEAYGYKSSYTQADCVGVRIQEIIN